MEVRIDPNQLDSLAKLIADELHIRTTPEPPPVVESDLDDLMTVPQLAASLPGDYEVNRRRIYRQVAVAEESHKKNPNRYPEGRNLLLPAIHRGSERLLISRSKYVKTAFGLGGTP